MAGFDFDAVLLPDVSAELKEFLEGPDDDLEIVGNLAPNLDRVTRPTL